jgi:hypothetical protein
MNYLEIFPDDVIIKILDTRCDDIERDIDRLYYKLSCIKNSVEGLSIDKKSTEQFEEELEEYVRNNEIYEEGFNGRYTIYFDNLSYCSNEYLYDIIFNGECIMSHTILYFDDNGEIEEYALFESDVIRNPIMLDLLRFTSNYVDEDENHHFVEGVEIKKKASRIDKDGNQYDTISLFLGS